MVYRKTYRTHNIGEQAEVDAVAMGLVGWLGGLGDEVGKIGCMVP